MFKTITTSLQHSTPALARATLPCALAVHPAGIVFDSHGSTRRGCTFIAATDFIP